METKPYFQPLDSQPRLKVRREGDALRPAMKPDIEKYRRYVDDFDLTEDQKVELIHTVWAIVGSVVDEAFGVHPVQLCRPGSRRGISNGTDDQVDSRTHSLEGEFAEVTGSPGDRKIRQ